MLSVKKHLVPTNTVRKFLNFILGKLHCMSLKSILTKVFLILGWESQNPKDPKEEY